MLNNRAHDWLRQADSDAEFASAAVSAGFYAQACFIAQQCAEKAVKAILYHRNAESVIGHSLMKLCQAAGINGELSEAAKQLDQYYISSRYPDALPAGAPCDAFTRTQAEQAVAFAHKFVSRATHELVDG